MVKLRGQPPKIVAVLTHLPYKPCPRPELEFFLGETSSFRAGRSLPIKYEATKYEATKYEATKYEATKYETALNKGLRGCFKSPLRWIKITDPPFLVCPIGSKPPTLRKPQSVYKKGNFQAISPIFSSAAAR